MMVLDSRTSAVPERAEPPPASLRHARTGTVGVDGQLPAGWLAESMSSVVVEDIDPPESSIVLEFQFEANMQSDYVSLVIGPFLRPRRKDIYVSRVEMAVTSAENIDAAYFVVREWIENGACVSQTARPIKLSDQFEVGIVGAVGDEQDRLLQPAISFRRKTPSAGRAHVILRRPVFASIYDYPGWLK